MPSPRTDPLPKFLFPLFLIFFVASCVPATRWENPNVPPGRSEYDRAECRRKASADLEREYRREDLLGRRDEQRYEFERQQTRIEAGKRRDALFNRCMRYKGYTRVRAGGRK